MTVLRSIAMAFAMFSKIPTPHVEWRDESMRYLLAFFPLVGVAIAALLLLWWWVCDLLGIGQVLFATGLTLIPLAVTGGIHLDGLIDTSDALGSHAEPERKREILKDSHVGAFGVIAATAYVLLYFGLACELPQTLLAVACMGCAHVLSRITSGTISLAFQSGGNGMLKTFNVASEKRGAFIVLLVFAVADMALFAWLCWPAAIAALAVDVATACWVHHLAYKQFSGMSGDLAGYFLQIAEVAMLAALVVVSLVS
jgi:adenosylcobinamide-GDP ribazoletransferase